ncbi:hypothetical protein [Lacrimispora sp.]|uniref:hypothetical protein n=1 Tax=Lacrimispora sp. TaxID=2719234 RepID=UPI0028AFBC6F|nr:hypothetical protein [Lacrimispora sp.]
MRRVFSTIGYGMHGFLKGIIWLILNLLRLLLELAKVILLLFGLVLRVFLAFVRAGAP